MGFNGFYLVLLGFTGFDWVWLGFIGSYWVWLGYAALKWVPPRFLWLLPGFTEFDQILPSFTWFYRVLLAFTWENIFRKRVSIDFEKSSSANLEHFSTMWRHFNQIITNSIRYRMEKLLKSFPMQSSFALTEIFALHRVVSTGFFISFLLDLLTMLYLLLFSILFYFFKFGR